MWGFPNNNSHYGFIKNLNWIDLEQIPTFSIKVDTIKKTGFSQINNVTFFNEKYIRTQNRLTDVYKIKVNKTLEYLNWRYLNNPINKYDIFECIDNDNAFFAVTKVFRSFNDQSRHEVDILEINFPPDIEKLLELMNAIKHHYLETNLLQINIWLPCSNVLHLQLEKIGFSNMQPITYSGLRVLDSEFENLTNSKEWLYTMGDSDIY